jgi:filamentous hemagglutinin family protein
MVAGKAQYNITGGTQAGPNLFHSFGEFNVPTNSIANFHKDSSFSPSTIVGRVTGGDPSNILGTIQTTEFGNASLFLMNPYGIIFGPNAAIHVGGSVAFTTADYLRFTDNGRFNAIPNSTADALLSTEPVAAYGFLGSNPGAITVRGSQIAIPERQGISFVGGNITVQNGTLTGTVQPARVSTTNGQINLATSQSPGEFLQNLTTRPNINGASFTTFGSVHLAPGSIVDVSRNGSDKVSIRGGQLFLEIHSASLDTANTTVPTAGAPSRGSIVLSDGSSIVSQTSSRDQSPDIHIHASQISVGGILHPLTNPESHPSTSIKSNTEGIGNSGNILLTATGDINIHNSIESTSGFNLDGTDRSPVQATGHAGNITFTSEHGDIRLTGSDQSKIQVASHTFNSSGNTGEIIVSANEGDIVLDRSVLFTNTLGTGAPGKTQITANNFRLINAIVTDENFGATKSGGITIDLSDNLTLADSSVIATASMSPTGTPAADINIKAKDIVVTQESIINSATFAKGSGGDLKIVTDTLQVTDGAQLSSGSTRAPIRLMFPPNFQPTGDGGNITIRANTGPTGSVVIDGRGSGIFADTEGTGAGGTINLSAKTLTIQNGGTISASTTGTNPRATGGSIIVNATNNVSLSNGGSITASSFVNPETPNSGIADAGKIFINGGRQLDLLDRSSITTTTQSAKANGGNIDIRAIDRVRLVNGSKISTSVEGADGSGGNIFIDPNVVILEGSDITARAIGGAGGNITFVTPLFLMDSASVVSATSQRGVSGTVTIQSPTSNLSGTVGQLVSKVSPPQVLLQNRCVALASGEQSTFILAGRDALPSEPGGWLSSPVAMEHWTGEDTEHATGVIAGTRKLNESRATIARVAQGEVLSLRRLTPPGFLVRTFATGPTGCPS